MSDEPQRLFKRQRLAVPDKDNDEEAEISAEMETECERMFMTSSMQSQLAIAFATMSRAHGIASALTNIQPAAVEVARPPGLLSLPNDIITIAVGSFLRGADMLRLSNTNKKANTSLNSVALKNMRIEFSRRMQALERVMLQLPLLDRVGTRYSEEIVPLKYIGVHPESNLMTWVSIPFEHSSLRDFWVNRGDVGDGVLHKQDGEMGTAYAETLNHRRLLITARTYTPKQVYNDEVPLSTLQQSAFQLHCVGCTDTDASLYECQNQWEYGSSATGTPWFALREMDAYYRKVYAWM